MERWRRCCSPAAGRWPDSVAVHVRGGLRGRRTTLPEHMPQAHRRHAEWTIERIGREAAAIGPATAAPVALVLESRPHPEQGFRACLGILRLLRTYGRDRLEAACTRGIEIGARSYGAIAVRGSAPHPAARPRPPASTATGAGQRGAAATAPEHPWLRLLPLRSDSPC
jgi:transposase